MTALVRRTLPYPSRGAVDSHRQASAPVSLAEVQTTTRQTRQSMGVAACCPPAPAGALRPPGVRRCHQRPACGSRMTGDCHVRFCEGGSGRFPPATHQSRGCPGGSSSRPSPPGQRPRVAEKGCEDGSGTTPGERAYAVSRWDLGDVDGGSHGRDMPGGGLLPLPSCCWP